MSGTQTNLEELLDIRRLARHLQMPGQSRTKSHQLGGHLSSLRGRGIDFSEVREYQPGDDIRLMHWGVTARTGKPHAKIYHEERERPTFIILDLSPTMYFATKVEFKSVHAIKTAAMLGWATIQNNDRLGGMITYGNDLFDFRPRSRKLSLLPFLKQSADCSQKPPGKDQTTDWVESLKHLHRVIRPGSLVFIISDFYTLEDQARSLLTKIVEHNEVIACRICDPLEIKPPPPDYYVISNGHEEMALDTRSTQCYGAYQQQLGQWWNKQKQNLMHSGIHVLELTTDGNLLKDLQHGLYQ